MPQHKEQEPPAPKQKSEAQLWSRLRKLKDRRLSLIAEYEEELSSAIAKIDAEITDIKATLGTALNEQ